ncbi:H(+)/Cl(-) exchange transporter ClcA [Amaricoccus solimangrovi]|uniref:H(+)/Cl(-) exchange transporter ClcA n=1 Tax=Amaricoccus solimangrovi TaxID=2589815 RepID=A0A501WY03_9RHOB|nr:H(+)/Cl(-) exchange transporter ClcA [Amaricoccus solimangrovi]TPE53135.1 H(+)/Cl(-) exchange transporter ClcA [Amaricoccus solimangrovi]
MAEPESIVPHHDLAPPREGHLLFLACLAPLIGVASGLVCALFRLALEAAVHLRVVAVGAARTLGPAGLPLVMLVMAVLVGAAAWMVRRFSPHASGSGIPHVEAVIEGELPPAHGNLLVVKFIGGVLAIGSGLALGREGPSVQMGASIAHTVGRLFRRDWADCRVLMAAGAGSGLATAFNAPIAGAVFVLEELVRRFEPRIAIVILAATASAISVARVLLGDAPDFHVDVLDYGDPLTHLLYGVLGIVAGFAAIAHNRMILGGLALAGRLSFVPVEIRAGTVGAVVGLLAWYLPDMIGGGDGITQAALLGQQALMMIPLILVLRMVLGSASYAAGTPGGLFAPMLVLGALLGLGVGLVLHRLLPFVDIQPAAFAVVGMAAFFVGVARAPVTGIVLVTEMTASVDLLVPMLGACFAAMLVPTLLKDPPIYDSLRAATLRREAERLSRG